MHSGVQASVRASAEAGIALPSGRVIEVRDLNVAFRRGAGTFNAVRDLLFHVDRGETPAIVGESGSGKSVTSLALMRLVEHGGGRDIFSRVVAGTRISLAAGFLSVALGAVVGTFFGLLAGYYEGWWDCIKMRTADVLFAFPGILFAIGVVAILGNGMINVICAVAVFSIPAFARLVRGNTLMLKHLTYVEAARSIGASDWVIIMRHILPGTVSSVVVYLAMRIGTSIITAASLSFLGLGAQPPTPEWGAMLNEARADMVSSPHIALFPSLAIFFTVLAFNLLGDGLRDALDPKLDRA